MTSPDVLRFDEQYRMDDVTDLPFIVSYLKDSNKIYRMHHIDGQRGIYLTSIDVNGTKKENGAKTVTLVDFAAKMKSAKNVHAFLYIVDMPARIISGTTVRDVFALNRKKRSSNATKPIDEEVKVITYVQPKQETVVTEPLDTTPSHAAPQSAFSSTKSIYQKYLPEAALIDKVNRYDQTRPQLLCRNWLSSDEITKGNSHWNPISTCFAIFYYISKSLKWALHDTRVVVDYQHNAVPLDTLIQKVYKMYGIENRFDESNVVTRMLVWCIASMKSYGIVRPMVLKATSESAFRIAPMCASKQKHDRVLYFVTWAFWTDSHEVYILHNNTKLNHFKIKDTILADLHMARNAKKMLKEIPDWVYGMWDKK